MGKAFEKQTKTIEDQGKKQVDALKSLKFSDEEEQKKKVNRNKMVYKSTNKTYDFRNFKTIRAFGSEIRNNVINEDMANNEQAKLINYIEEFSRSTIPRDPELIELKKRSNR